MFEVGLRFAVSCATLSFLVFGFPGAATVTAEPRAARLFLRELDGSLWRLVHALAIHKVYRVVVNPLQGYRLVYARDVHHLLHLGVAPVEVTEVPLVLRHVRAPHPRLLLLDGVVPAPVKHRVVDGAAGAPAGHVAGTAIGADHVAAFDGQGGQGVDVVQVLGLRLDHGVAEAVAAVQGADREVVAQGLLVQHVLGAVAEVTEFSEVFPSFFIRLEKVIVFQRSVLLHLF